MMDKSPSTSRRVFLTSAAAASAAGLVGCLGRDESSGGTPRFDFGGVLVSSRPQAEEHQPLDVSVEIQQTGEVRYDETHTIDNVVHDVAVIVKEEWMESRVPYTITLSTPVHEDVTFATAEFDEESDRFVDELVYFEFALNKRSITVHPVTGDESELQ